MVFNFLRKKKQSATEEEKARKKEADEEAALQKRMELLDRLLPWRIEQKIAMVLNPIKIPIIIVVGILGCIVEYRMGLVETNAWKAPVWRDGPTCYVHAVTGPILNTSALGGISEMLNSTLYPLTSVINATLQSRLNCTYDDETGANRCELFDSEKYGIALKFKADHCGITDQCTLETNEDGSDIFTENGLGSGLEWRIPFVPFSLIWAVYKLVFLPVHPVDRLSNLLVGNPTPMPEPIFKLLTEPNFQTCSGVMGVIVTIGKIIRYSMLPNSLMVPLLTMGSHPKCKNFVYYDMDTMFGHVIYFWVIFDLVCAVAFFALGKTVLGGICVGTWKYRIYKTYWFLSLLTVLTLFIADFFVLFNIRFWEGLAILLKLAITVDLDFNFAIDVVQALATVNIILDIFQLLIMILVLILPKLLGRCPACAKYLPEDDGHDSREYQPIDGASRA